MNVTRTRRPLPAWRPVTIMFDEMTAGLQKGDLIIVAGRPSMGKTSLALNIAENIALNPAKPQPTAVFSMEMSTEQLALRMISSLGRVNQAHLRNGRFGDEEWPRINTAIQMMSGAPMFIDDTPAMTPTEIRARARRLKRQHGLELIVVDYLQLMQVAGNTENRATEISEISRSLKALARELEVPIIALSQLNQKRRAADGEEADDVRSARVRRHRAGCGSDYFYLSRRSLRQEHAA